MSQGSDFLIRVGSYEVTVSFRGLPITASGVILDVPVGMSQSKQSVALRRARFRRIKGAVDSGALSREDVEALRAC